MGHGTARRIIGPQSPVAMAADVMAVANRAKGPMYSMVETRVFRFFIATSGFGQDGPFAA